MRPNRFFLRLIAKEVGIDFRREKIGEITTLIPKMYRNKTLDDVLRYLAENFKPENDEERRVLDEVEEYYHRRSKYSKPEEWGYTFKIKDRYKKEHDVIYYPERADLGAIPLAEYDDEKEGFRNTVLYVTMLKGGGVYAKR